MRSANARVTGSLRCRGKLHLKVPDPQEARLKGKSRLLFALQVTAVASVWILVMLAAAFPVILFLIKARVTSFFWFLLLTAISSFLGYLASKKFSPFWEAKCKDWSFARASFYSFILSIPFFLALLQSVVSYRLR